MDHKMRQSLDRHITGNYGADQFQEDKWECPGHDLRFIGREPNDYDYPETGDHPVYVCRNCGDLFDSATPLQTRKDK